MYVIFYIYFILKTNKLIEKNYKYFMNKICIKSVQNPYKICIKLV